MKEWTKKSECWAAVRALDLPLPDHLPPEFAQTVKQGGGWGVQPTAIRTALDPDDIDALAVCHRTDASDWVKIIEWGRNSGLVDQRQRLVATQLASLAANGWVKDPSVKDAKDGRRMVNAASEQGILERPSTRSLTATDVEHLSDETA